MINEQYKSIQPESAYPLEGRCFFVSRYQGTIDWAEQQSWAKWAEFVTHLDMTQLDLGDLVIGCLSLEQVAEVCARGAQYLHLLIPLCASHSKSALTAEDLETAGAYLVPFPAKLEAMFAATGIPGGGQ